MTTTGSSARASEPLIGLQLLRGAPGPVASWLRAGVVPVTVGRLGGWSAVLPRGRSRAAAPYDEPLPILASRPVPAGLGPAIGFWVLDGRAVIAVSGARRNGLRYVVWEQGTGVVRPPGLEVAPAQVILRAAGGGSRADLVELLRERHVAPDRLLAAVVTTLELPGARLLIDPADRSELRESVAVEPEDKQVAIFDDVVRDAVLLRRELEPEPGSTR